MDQNKLRTLDDIRVGFVISHPFHFFIYQPLIRALKNPVVVIETRRKTPFAFSNDFLRSLGCPHLVIDERHLKSVDQQMDVIFVMTPKHLEVGFAKAKTVLMQYGMAKEYYNYGLWRCLGDLNMMFGPYSTRQIEGFAVARAVGNTRLDGFQPKKIGGGGLLYLPTYGALSTLGRFADMVDRLNPAVPVKVKLHHASEFEDAEIVARLKTNKRITLLDGYRDALDDIAEADVVLSDYSGAIFDAFFLERPIALYQPGYTQTVKRTSDASLEIDRGGDFGEVLSSDQALIAFFDRLAEGQPLTPPKADRAEFLSNPGAAVPVALALLEQLINDEIPRSTVQESILDTYQKLMARPARETYVGYRQLTKHRISRLLFGS